MFLPRSAVGWYAVCGCGISLSYLLSHFSHVLFNRWTQLQNGRLVVCQDNKKPTFCSKSSYTKTRWKYFIFFTEAILVSACMKIIWPFKWDHSRFLERGFICIKGWGFALLILSHFFLNIPWKWNNLVSLRPNYELKYFGLIETKLFHFHRIFKNRGQGGGLKQTPSGSTTA